MQYSKYQLVLAVLAEVQALMNAFSDELGSYICRDIIKVIGSQPPTPTPRTAEFYKARPCVKCVMRAARLVDTQILGLTDTEE